MDDTRLATPGLKVGVISDCPLQRKNFAEVLSRYGMQVAISCAPESLEHQSDERMTAINCWLVDLDDDTAPEPVLDKLEQFDQPVLFGPGRAPHVHDESYISWERRLIAKLEGFLGRIATLESTESLQVLEQDDGSSSLAGRSVHKARSEIADEVWILAASLGGPSAVKEFLDCLPEDLPFGFYYAQHIDEAGAKVLCQVLARHSALDLKPASAGAILRKSQVLMVPVEHQIRFSEVGVVFTDHEWPGPYGPSIDQLLANALAYYGARCHVIVFSGMGNDGALTIPRMKQAGCTVWTQSPESCASASMPSSVLELGCSDFSAPPKALAQALLARVEKG